MTDYALLVLLQATPSNQLVATQLLEATHIHHRDPLRATHHSQQATHSRQATHSSRCTAECCMKQAAAWATSS